VSLIRTEGLIKNHGDGFRLGPIDLQLAPGQVLGVIGPYGAGKTTLLKLIWGFQRPDKGSISFFGLRPHLEQVAVRMRAGYVAAAPQFYDSMTVRRHLEFVSQFYIGWDAGRVAHLLSIFGIDPITPVRELHRCARIKLGLIAAVGHDPSVVLLDEPVAGLDRRARQEIFDFLSALAKDKAVALMITSEAEEDLRPLIHDIVSIRRKN
jgi:ABC-2 type transport system ATP-binding protein